MSSGLLMNIVRFSGRLLLVMCAFAPLARAQELAATSPQPKIDRLLSIRWTRGTDLPQGFQDSDGGFLHDTLITAGGFCSGIEADNARKPGRYPRGFLRKVWGLQVDDAAPKWTRLPDFPGTPRQGLFSARLDDALCFFGGFNYDDPFCYADGWRLRRQSDGVWLWDELPSLPYKLTSAAMAVVGRRLFVVGGADYDGVTGFFTEADRSGGEPRLGAHLLMLNLDDLNSGWKRLADCPGTPRFVHTVQAVHEKLYVIGGATGDLVRNGVHHGTGSVVDNWRYDPAANQWSRLRDLPVSSGNFPKSSNLVFRDRWIILPGGHQYSKVANPDGTIREPYGKASRKRPESGLHNDVFVYDTQTDRFGSADELPIDNNLPMSVVRGDRIYLLGGETGGGDVDGEYFGHHPDLLLIGEIAVIEKRNE